MAINPLCEEKFDINALLSLCKFIFIHSTYMQKLIINKKLIKINNRNQIADIKIQVNSENYGSQITL